jgi:predicted CoA-binding protein
MKNNRETIKKVLNFKNWAIVGLSTNQDRPAFHVSKFLVDNGYKIFPVHPKGETVHGFKGYKSLSEIVQSGIQIDVVDIFVNSDLAGAVVDEAISIKAKAVWLQGNIYIILSLLLLLLILEGVIDENACVRANQAGVLSVMNTCPVVELR